MTSAPARQAAAMSWPVPEVVAASGSRSSGATKPRPLAAAVSTTATRRRPGPVPSTYSAVTGRPRGSLTSSLTRSQPRASHNASSVPSPPSASGQSSTGTPSASSPRASALATSTALNVPLKESGARRNVVGMRGRRGIGGVCASARCSGPRACAVAACALKQSEYSLCPGRCEPPTGPHRNRGGPDMTASEHDTQTATPTPTATETAATPPGRTPIHALSTGTVQIKTAMQQGRSPARLLRTLLDRSYTGELPIHAWVIEHPEGPILVDTGELSSTPNPPVARFHVRREEEIDRLLDGLGLAPSDLVAVVLTHLHGDHRNGLARLPGVRVLVSAEALTRGGAWRLRRRGATPEPLELTSGPFGGFTRSAPITADRRVVAVPVPGHARGQIAVAVVEPGHHVLLAGDSAYTQGQLLALAPDGVSISPGQAVASMRAILDHARLQPTVFLPSHDPESAARLNARSPLPVS